MLNMFPRFVLVFSFAIITFQNDLSGNYLTFKAVNGA